MSEISAVNTLFYPESIEFYSPKSTMPVPAVQAESTSEKSTYDGNYSSDDEQSVDLSNYYNDVRPEDLLTKAGQYFVESSKNLDNTMVVAMQNGYSVQDVCNIKLAEMAYKASAYVFDVAEDMSTFALDV